MAKIEELILKAKSLGHKYIAITDHGSSAGFYDATALSQKHDFPVLLGQEFYFESSGDERKLGHLILIAKSQQGLENIFKLQELAFNNFYYKPRLNLDLLKLHSEDLVCTSACIANQINQYILAGEEHLALAHAKDLHNIFGDDFYLELQSSTMEDVIVCNKKLEEFCNNYNYKPIITNDIHYVDKEDYEVHEVLLAIQQKQQMSSKKRWKFDCNDYWLKTQKEMEADVQYLQDETIQSSYQNLDEIYEKCVGVKLKKGYFLPRFLPTKEEEDQHLEELVNTNYVNKVVARGEESQKLRYDLKKELKVISDTGYSGYFLIVQEYINWAKENGIFVGDGRGSGAGSKVAYTIGITEVNPEKYDLLFERFLSPGRSPDFDVDFSDIDAVYEHLQDVYGRENVARVGAFTRFTAKSALRKVMGIYGFSMSEINKVVKYMPDLLTFTLQEAREYSKELDKWLLDKPNILRCVEKFEGMLSHFSTHAGGVIICEDLPSKLPIMVSAKDKEKYIVEFDKDIIEELGHYKFDILGLNSLILMKDIVQYTGQIDWHTVQFDDQNIYDDLCAGDVIGVFQLSDQKDKIVEQQPRNFDDLVAINALIRPGVGDWHEYIKRRKENSGDIFSRGLKYLKPTAGVIVYQDQYLLLANTYAGWDIAYSDKHIRKNKDIKNDTKLRSKFIEDAIGNEYSEEEALEVWKDIENVVASGYGFNKCLAGNTKLFRLGNSSFHPTIEQMYKIKNNRDYAKSIGSYDLFKKYKQLGYGKCLSLYNDNVILKNNIVDIRQAGIKPLYQITTSTGKTIKCTDNHKFPTPQGIRELKDIKVGDCLYVKGERNLIERTYNLTNGEYESNIPQKGQMGRVKAYENGYLVETEEITDITYIGDEMTYDIEVQEPAHNFVIDNGIVTSNSHSTSYARLSFQTAYMKHYYPKEFYAAYMSQNIGDAAVIQSIITIVERLGIKMLLPDINLSTDKFIPTEEGILFPLTAINGVGGSAMYEINRLKPIESFEDFMERRTPKFVKRTALAALIKAGAFSFTGKSIHELLIQVDSTAEEQQQHVYEKESLGLYLTKTPFQEYSIPTFNSIPDGSTLATIVEISEVNERYDRNGNVMAFVTGFNDNDVIRFVIFSSIWKVYKCEVGQLMVIRGKKDKSSVLVAGMDEL